MKIRLEEWNKEYFCTSEDINKIVSIHFMRNKKTDNPMKVCDNYLCKMHLDCNLNRDSPDFQKGTGKNYVNL